MYSNSQFRRPWSPEPFETLPSNGTLMQRNDHHDDNPYPLIRQQRQDGSDVSVEALDLADYARTLRTHQHKDLYPTYPPSPLRPLPSRDSLQPPSLVSRGGTSSATHSSSRRSRTRPFSLPPSRNTDTSRRTNNMPYLAEPRIQSYDEIDISHFPAWSRSWYNPPITSITSSPPQDIYTPLPTSHLNSATKRSLFDPRYMHNDSNTLPSDPYDYDTPASSLGHDSTRDLLPWGVDPMDYNSPVDSSLKEERIRMLEREFGPNGKNRSQPTRTGEFLDENGKPMVGTVDEKGKLVTQGPKKRMATRVLQILFALIACIPSIYAALVIKPKETPPPSGKPPAFVLYILSVATLLLFGYIFVIRPCCCTGKRSKTTNGNPLADAMMVLPVQGPSSGKKGRNKKGAKKGKGKKGEVGSGDVQVNLIVDPNVFERREEDDSEDEGEEWGIPGGYGTGKKRKRPRRRGILAGLAMEAEWKRARGWAKKMALIDTAGMACWGAAFVLILIGKRCPSGGFEGWCNAYNVSSASACLLCVTFGPCSLVSINDIEALVLSGELFNGKPRSSSPERSPSPDAGWHDDEITPQAKRRQERGYDADSDEEWRDMHKAQENHGESIGMGPGRTGVKGVIRDRNESVALEREKREREVDIIQKRIEKSHLGGKTFLDEEREKGLDEKVDELVLKERQATAEKREDMFGREREGRFGHLREVGVKGFLRAIEEENRGVWVVVHLYDSSLERCYLIDETLARLARLYPDTKFLRARASALGFASRKSVPHTQISRSNRLSDPDDDDDESDQEDDDEQEDNVDLDMLPTMLVYRDGELVHNWVRVDWEAGRADVEELLDQHHILSRPKSTLGIGSNLGLPSDGDDDNEGADFDLLWSDDDDINHT